jgi:tetratricopeptide (TPR) repeat protein
METFDSENIIKVAIGGELKNRPVSNFSIAINNMLNNYNVKWYHIFNVAVHINASIILFFLIKVTLSLPPNREKYKHYASIAFFTATLWLVHPLATQSVTYIIQRMNSMATMFYLLSVLLYALARQKQQKPYVSASRLSVPSWLFLGSVLSALLAIGSKEIAVTLPIIIFIYEWYFFQGLSREWIIKKIPWAVVALLSLFVWFFVFLGENPIASIMHSCDNREFTTAQRLMTQLRVIVHYLGLILYPNPNRLVFDYNIPVSTSLLSPPSTLTSLAALFLLATSSLILAKKERLLSFCIVWFFVNLAVESSVICLELAYEHRTYLPSTFIILAIVALLFRGVRKREAACIVLTPIVILFSFWTFERNKTWQDEETFWNDTNAKHPNKPRVLNNIGNLYYYKGDYEKAAELYLKALSLNPKEIKALGNLTTTYLKMEEFDKAEHYLRLALSKRANWVDMMSNLATLHIKRNEYDKAVSLLRTALSFNPEHPTVNKNMGHVLLQTGRTNLALFFLEQAATHQPNNITLKLEIAEALMQSGRHIEAVAAYGHILELRPESVIAHYNLALLLLGSNDKEAKLHLEEVVKLSPYSVPALYNLANLLFRAGDLSKAEEYYLRILEVTPELANTNNNYGLLLIREGKYHEAAALFEQALRILPDNELARANLIKTRKRIEFETRQGN